MIEIRKKPRAEADLVEIWKRTLERWGEAQADVYVEGIARAIEALAEYPRLGAKCDWLRKGYRRLSVNHHHVYYTIADRHIEIIRILFERMDAERQLEE